MSTPYVSAQIQEALKPAIDDLLNSIREVELDVSDGLVSPVEDIVTHIIHSLMEQLFSATSYDQYAMSSAISILECCKLTLFDEHLKPAIRQSKYDCGMENLD